MKSQFKQVAIAVDQLVNTLIGLLLITLGLTKRIWYADETMSAHAWRMRCTTKLWHWARRLVDTLLWFDKDHCESSYKSEKDRLQLPPEYR